MVLTYVEGLMLAIHILLDYTVKEKSVEAETVLYNTIANY